MLVGLWGYETVFSRGIGFGLEVRIMAPIVSRNHVYRGGKGAQLM